MIRSDRHLRGRVLTCPKNGNWFLAWDREYERTLRECLEPCSDPEHHPKHIVRLDQFLDGKN